MRPFYYEKANEITDHLQIHQVIALGILYAHWWSACITSFCWKQGLLLSLVELEDFSIELSYIPQSLLPSIIRRMLFILLWRQFLYLELFLLIFSIFLFFYFGRMFSLLILLFQRFFVQFWLRLLWSLGIFSILNAFRPLN